VREGLNPKFLSVLFYIMLLYVNALSKMRVVGVRLLYHDFFKIGKFCMNSPYRAVSEYSWRAGLWADDTRRSELLFATASCIRSGPIISP
jgi:hypothetical protein